MLDKLAGGRLAERITTLRATGFSWEAIARQLHSEFDVTVTGETLRNWSKPPAEPEQAASA